MRVRFPFTPALPQGEGGTLSALWDSKDGNCLKAFEFYESNQRLFLLPEGEGQDEGEDDAKLAGKQMP
jgi:hypothetical protein